MPTLPLELDDESRRRMEAAVLNLAAEFVEAHRDGPPLSGPIDDGLTAELLEAPPEQSGAIDAVLDRLARALEPGLDTASGRFLAYIPTGGLYTAALGTFLAAATNQYSAGAHAAPGHATLDELVAQSLAPTACPPVRSQPTRIGPPGHVPRPRIEPRSPPSKGGRAESRGRRARSYRSARPGIWSGRGRSRQIRSRDVRGSPSGRRGRWLGARRDGGRGTAGRVGPLAVRLDHRLE